MGSAGDCATAGGTKAAVSRTAATAAVAMDSIPASFTPRTFLPLRGEEKAVPSPGARSYAPATLATVVAMAVRRESVKVSPSGRGALPGRRRRVGGTKAGKAEENRVPRLLGTVGALGCRGVKADSHSPMPNGRVVDTATLTPRWAGDHERGRDTTAGYYAASLRAQLSRIGVLGTSRISALRPPGRARHRLHLPAAGPSCC